MDSAMDKSSLDSQNSSDDDTAGPVSSYCLPDCTDEPVFITSSNIINNSKQSEIATVALVIQEEVLNSSKSFISSNGPVIESHSEPSEQLDLDGNDCQKITCSERRQNLSEQNESGERAADELMLDAPIEEGPISDGLSVSNNAEHSSSSRSINSYKSIETDERTKVFLNDTPQNDIVVIDENDSTSSSSNKDATSELVSENLVNDASIKDMGKTKSIMPVRLEKLMDPSKLKNSVFFEETTSVNQSLPVNSGNLRPQRQAAKKAGTQIRGLVTRAAVAEKKNESQNKIGTESKADFPSQKPNIRVVSNSKYHTVEAVQNEKINTTQNSVSNSLQRSLRKCSQCKKEDIIEEKSMSWETMDFCGEECLGQYQQKFKKKCSFCLKPVDAKSLCKYAVRFGFDIQQFCSADCLDHFKREIKQCSYCQIRIADKSKIVQSSATKKENPRDFCSEKCRNAYVHLRAKISVPPTEEKCTVCSQFKIAEFQMVVDEVSNALCSEVCFNAFNFIKNINDITRCDLCSKNFDIRDPKTNVVFHKNNCHSFCSKICRSVFVLFERDITTCAWCKVNKYNFDMIRKSLAGNQFIYACSLNCLSLIRSSKQASRKAVCDGCRTLNTIQVQLAMPDSTIKYFCSQNCLKTVQIQPTKIQTLAETAKTKIASIPTSSTNKVASRLVPNEIGKKSVTAPKIGIGPKTRLLPQVSSAGSALKIPPISVTSPVSSPSNATATPAIKYIQHIVVRPPEVKDIANKMTQCQPLTKDAKTEIDSLEVHDGSSTVNNRTGTPNKYPAIVPIPVPVYVPVPMHMFTSPCPVPFPVPFPIPVPVFIPTTHKTFEKLNSAIKEIVDRTPTNQLEYDVVKMARKAAEDAEYECLNNSHLDDDSDSVGHHSDSYLSDDVSDETNYLNPNVNTNHEPNKINNITSPGEFNDSSISTYDDKSEESPAESNDNQSKQVWSKKRNSSTWNAEGISSPKRSRLLSNNDIKCTEESIPSPNESIDNFITTQTINGANDPDHQSSLKPLIALRGWKQWLVKKNQDVLTKDMNAKVYDLNILKLMPDELDYLLSEFVHEVRMPNGDEFAPDAIYYMCLSIQKHFYLNRRAIDIFSETEFGKFADALDDIARRFTQVNNESQYIMTRVEEEHLWECKQLGAHSPLVLLATIMYFNTKYFNIQTIEEHKQISFSQIRKSLTRNSSNDNESGKTSVFRFHPSSPSDHKRICDLPKSEIDPLRCPDSLYQFYMSKCPENAKQSGDLFYLEPELPHLPTRPVWYTSSPLNDNRVNKIFHRILMVKEVNVSLLDP